MQAGTTRVKARTTQRRQAVRTTCWRPLCGLCCDGWTWVTWTDTGGLQLQGLLHTTWLAGVVVAHLVGQRWGSVERQGEQEVLSKGLGAAGKACHVLEQQCHRGKPPSYGWSRREGMWAGDAPKRGGEKNIAGRCARL
jgi:hypothetical protein